MVCLLLQASRRHCHLSCYMMPIPIPPHLCRTWCCSRETTTAVSDHNSSEPHTAGEGGAAAHAHVLHRWRSKAAAACCPPASTGGARVRLSAPPSAQLTSGLLPPPYLPAVRPDHWYTSAMVFLLTTLRVEELVGPWADLDLSAAPLQALPHL